MKESNKIPEPLFDRKDFVKQPRWVQSTVIISHALSPLVENLAPVATAAIILDIITKIFGR